MFTEAKDIISRFRQMESERSNWNQTWEDTCTYVTPRRGGIISPNVKGGTRMSRVFSTTAIDANDVFAAGLYGHLCSPPWFVLRPTNPKDRGTITDIQAQWFSLATSILHDELALSNFNLMIFEHFKDLGSIGTGCLILDRGDKVALNFKNLFIGDFMIVEDKHGHIDTILRRIKYTTRQALQEFGDDAGKSVMDAKNDPKRQDEMFEFIHVIKPRSDYSPWPARGDRRSYASIFVSVKDERIVKESGYYEKPFMADRLDKESNEVYGRGIGIKMLPEIKLLNKIVETTLRAAEKVVDPPLQVPDDGFLSPLRTVPGEILYYRAGTTDKVEPLNTHANVGLGVEMEQKREEAIRKAFFVDLFQLLAERKNMTATEVLERVEEKLIILGPMLGRLQDELFNPLIERSLGILFREGKIPPPPEGIDSYSITYTGKLAMAMRQMEVRSSQSTLSVLEPWAMVRPDILDNFDTDSIARGVGIRLGLLPEWFRSEDAVTEIRRQRMEQERAMQTAEVARNAARVLPDETKDRVMKKMGA